MNANDYRAGNPAPAIARRQAPQLTSFVEVEGSANLVDFVTDPAFRQIKLTDSHGHDLVQPGVIIRAGLEIRRRAEIVVGWGHRFPPRTRGSASPATMPS